MKNKKNVFVMVVASVILIIIAFIVIQNFNSNQNIFEYNSPVKVSGLNEDFEAYEYDINQRALGETIYSGILNDSLNQDNFNLYEVNFNNGEINLPKNMSTEKDALLFFSRDGKVIAKGIIYKKGRGCIVYCKEGQLDSIFGETPRSGLYDEYEANWLINNVNFKLQFKENTRFKHTIIGYFKPSTNDLIDDYEEEIGFIISEENISTFDKQLFEVWKDYETHVKYLESIGVVNYE